MTLLSTRPGQIGELVADAIRESLGKATRFANIATYAEQESPLEWSSVAHAGWDLAGVRDDEDSATLRDLVEIARVWGEFSIPLPLMCSILAKRHSESAASHDGPVTFSVSTQTAEPGTGMALFGQVKDIAIAHQLGASNDLVAPITHSRSDSFAPTLLLAAVPVITELSPEAAREVMVVFAAEASGVCARAVREAVAYTKQREQFGRPIGSFQAVKHHLANAHMASEQAETAVIWASLDPQNARRSSLHSFNQSIRAIELAIQVHGGLGFTWEMGIHFYLRHVIALREIATGLHTHA